MAGGAGGGWPTSGPGGAGAGGAGGLWESTAEAEAARDAERMRRLALMTGSTSAGIEGPPTAQPPPWVPQPVPIPASPVIAPVSPAPWTSAGARAQAEAEAAARVSPSAPLGRPAPRGGFGGPGLPRTPSAGPEAYVPRYGSLEAVKAAYDRGEIDYPTAFRQSALIREQAPTGVDPGAAALRGGWETPAGLSGRLAASQIAGEQEAGRAAVAGLGREAEAAEGQAAAQAELASRRAVQEQEAGRQRAEFQADYQRRMADYDVAAKELAETRITPHGFFDHKGTGPAIAGAIAFGMMAVGAALKGGSTNAQMMIERAIDRDIDAQKANLAGKQAALGAKRSALGLARERLGDIDAAAAAVKASAYEQTALKVQRMRDQITNVDARGKADALLGDLSRKRNEAVMQVDLASKIAAQQQAQSAAWVRANAGRVVASKAGPDDEKRYVAHLQGFAPDAKAAQQLRDAEAARRTLTANLQELSRLNREGNWMPGSADRARADALRQDTIYQSGKLAGAGALAEGELELFGKKIPSAFNATETDAAIQARLASAQQMIDQRVRDLENVTRVTPGALMTNTDAQGRQRREKVYLPESSAQQQGAVPFTPGAGGGE